MQRVLRGCSAELVSAQARRGLGVPSPVVYSYLTNVYQNKFTALLLAGRTAEVIYVTLSLGAF